MGPRATHYFIDEVLGAFERTVRPTCDQDYPDLFVHFACSNPDRTAALLEDDPRRLRQILVDQLWVLAEQGCDTLVVPCISAHAVLDPIPVELPVLDLRRAALEHLVARTREPGAIGVLGTRGTNASIRGGALRTMSPCPIHVLGPADEERLMSAIYGDLKTAAAGEATIDVLLALCERLRGAGAVRVVAGCTEIEMALAASPRRPADVVLPLRIAAARVAAPPGCAAAV